ncbi:MAG: YraN family protein [Actinobacteria bacterium]|nr:YraN family protein [Actinomycetota bacterium]MCG2819580.1 YraN family protein [Actinomycetes bacterium]MBU4179016.1 YraN family protein [Actinomycetota bacterium]MBU4218005.1 YraN family protein [Actinomycetota bacterium]MBU4358270.1 YraN family protein [Actinomycetota bacterium]
MTDRRKALGRLGEDLACRHLDGEGFEIVERNWRTRDGEIDIVARKGDLIAFVEVKARRGDRFGEPEESVTPLKMRRIRRVAAQYLRQAPASGEVRFDVIGIRFGAGDTVTELRHTEAAF